MTRIVPEKPTEAMLAAGGAEIPPTDVAGTDAEFAGYVYTAMIQAAPEMTATPKPPAGTEAEYQWLRGFEAGLIRAGEDIAVSDEEIRRKVIEELIERAEEETRPQRGMIVVGPAAASLQYLRSVLEEE